MQRPAYLRSLACLAIFCAGSACAGEYSYTMAASESASTAVGVDVATAPSGNANNRVEGMGARYLVAQDEQSTSSAVRSDEPDSPAVAPPTTPAAGSAGSDKRSSHRWQSLVPGAIK